MFRAAHSVRLSLFLVACGPSLIGCRDAPKLVPVEVKPGAEKITLAVLDDPALAQALRVPVSEWKARRGGSVEVIEVTARDLDAGTLSADALIYPVEMLSDLIADGRISSLSAETLDSKELAWSDIFSTVQQGVAAWDGHVYGAPLGAPTLVLLYRRDLLEAIRRDPPQTWAEYQELSALLADRVKLRPAAPARDAPWHASLEPLSPGWAGRMLLARAAAYARHRDHYSTLFNIEDLSPLIDGPPFVRALEELIAGAKAEGGELARLDPAGVREAFFAGQTALAITWPTAAGANAKSTSPALAVGFAELPGSERSYNYASKSWDTRASGEDVHVPLVSVAGRLGSVLAGSADAGTAAQLLAWLSGPQWGTEVASHSLHTTLYRRSQVEAPQAWVEGWLEPAAAKQYAATVQQTLSRKVRVDCLRIPHAADYDAALDTAVAAALDGEPADKALRTAAETWRKLNDQYGLQKQRAAYRRSLGLEP